MPNAEIKMNRIKSRHKSELALLGDVITTAQEALPKLATTAQNRVERRNMMNQVSTLAKFARADGFDPTRKLQYVANIDNEVWLLVLEMFAKYDEDGNFMDDGLLYKFDPEVGCVRLNKDFFYALLNYLEGQGIPCDMRGKIKLN